jgi:hypothetical protein
MSDRQIVTYVAAASSSNHLCATGSLLLAARANAVAALINLSAHQSKIASSRSQVKHSAKSL